MEALINALHLDSAAIQEESLATLQQQLGVTPNINLLLAETTNYINDLSLEIQLLVSQHISSLQQHKAHVLRQQQEHKRLQDLINTTQNLRLRNLDLDSYANEIRLGKECYIIKENLTLAQTDYLNVKNTESAFIDMNTYLNYAQFRRAYLHMNNIRCLIASLKSELKRKRTDGPLMFRATKNNDEGALTVDLLEKLEEVYKRIEGLFEQIFFDKFPKRMLRWTANTKPNKDDIDEWVDVLNEKHIFSDVTDAVAAVYSKGNAHEWLRAIVASNKVGINERFEKHASKLIQGDVLTLEGLQKLDPIVVLLIKELQKVREEMDPLLPRALNWFGMTLLHFKETLKDFFVSKKFNDINVIDKLIQCAQKWTEELERLEAKETQGVSEHKNFEAMPEWLSGIIDHYISSINATMQVIIVNKINEYPELLLETTKKIVASPDCPKKTNCLDLTIGTLQSNLSQLANVENPVLLDKYLDVLCNSISLIITTLNKMVDSQLASNRVVRNLMDKQTPICNMKAGEFIILTNDFDSARTSIIRFYSKATMYINMFQRKREEYLRSFLDEPDESQEAHASKNTLFENDILRQIQIEKQRSERIAKYTRQQKEELLLVSMKTKLLVVPIYLRTTVYTPITTLFRPSYYVNETQRINWLRSSPMKSLMYLYNRDIPTIIKSLFENKMFYETFIINIIHTQVACYIYQIILYGHELMSESVPKAKIGEVRLAMKSDIEDMMNGFRTLIKEIESEEDHANAATFIDSIPTIFTPIQDLLAAGEPIKKQAVLQLQKLGLSGRVILNILSVNHTNQEIYEVNKELKISEWDNIVEDPLNPSAFNMLHDSLNDVRVIQPISLNITGGVAPESARVRREGERERDKPLGFADAKKKKGHIREKSFFSKHTSEKSIMPEPVVTVPDIPDDDEPIDFDDL